MGRSSGMSMFALSSLEMVCMSPESGVAFRSGGDRLFFDGHDEGPDTGRSTRGVVAVVRWAIPDCFLDVSGFGGREAGYQGLFVVGGELDGDDR